jgi:hypothetical protein
LRRYRAGGEPQRHPQQLGEGEHAEHPPAIRMRIADGGGLSDRGQGVGGLRRATVAT